MLSELQATVLRILRPVLEAEGFVLAGGGALIVRGDVDRRTRDLDLFALTPEAVDRMAPRAARVLEEAGLAVSVEQAVPGFVRLEVSNRRDRTEVDLAADARLMPADPNPAMATLSGEELAVDKVLAVFGRAEARDFVDLAAVEQRFGLERLMTLAAEKDHGFNPDVFAEMTGRIDRLDRREFGLDDAAYEKLLATVYRWRQQALVISRGPDPGLGLDR